MVVGLTGGGSGPPAVGAREGEEVSEVVVGLTGGSSGRRDARTLT